MKRRSRVVGAIVVSLQLLGTSAARADEPPQAQHERRSIAAERAAVEAQARTAEAECRSRFVVSGCVADVQAQRRAALAKLRERELVLDEAKRQADANAQAQRVQAKRDEAATKPSPEPHAPAVKLRASQAPASAAHGSERVRPRSKTLDDAHEAARRAALQQQRLREADEHRQQVQQRDAERAARGKKAAQPLPVPSAASVAQIASAPAR